MARSVTRLSASMERTSGREGVRRRHAAAADNGDVRLVGDVALQHLLIIDVADRVAVAQEHVILLGVGQKAADGGKRLHPVVEGGAAVAEGRQNEEAVPAAGEVPRLARAQMIHQGLVVALGDHAHLVDARIDHVGEGEVDQAVAPAEGNRSHGAVVGQLADALLMHVGKNDAHHIVAAHYAFTSGIS